MRSPGPLDRRSPPPSPSPFDCLDAVYLAEARPGQGLPSPDEPEIAFAGRSNVGKSTLLNRLCQRRSLARTSRTPGCTRGVVLFRCALRNGSRFILADLPGYGFAERARSEREAWAGLIESYLLRRASLMGVVVLVDCRRGVQPEELQLAVYLRHIHRPFFAVATKIDKLSRGARAQATAAIHRAFRVPVVGASGETGEGREEVLRRMQGFLSHGAGPSQTDTVPSLLDKSSPKGANV